MLRVFFDFIPDAIWKHGRFAKTLSEKSLEFVLYKESNPVLLNLSLMLLPAEDDLILEKQGRKKNAFIARNIDYIKMILILLVEVIALHM